MAERAPGNATLPEELATNVAYDDSERWRAEGCRVVDNDGHVLAIACNEDMARKLSQAQRALAAVWCIEYTARLDRRVEAAHSRYDFRFLAGLQDILAAAGEEPSRIERRW